MSRGGAKALSIDFSDSELLNKIVETLRQVESSPEVRAKAVATLALLMLLADKLGVPVDLLLMYIHDLISSTNYIQDEIRAINIVLDFVKERYQVENCVRVDRPRCRISKVSEELPWDLEAHIEGKGLILVEVGVHSKKDIERKISSIMRIFESAEDLKCDMFRSTKDRRVRYPEMLFIHINAKTMEINLVKKLF